MRFLFLAIFCLSMSISFTEIKSFLGINFSKKRDNQESLLSCLSFNPIDFLKNLGGYGISWIYFPDGNGVPQIAQLSLPDINSLFYMPIENFVSFHLYTRKNYNTSIILKVNDTKTLINSNYDSKKKTKFMIHGWQSSELSDTCQVIKNNFLDVDDYNVFCVDWSKIANNINFLVAAYETINVGALVANFVDFLVVQGSNIMNIDLLGHSLGAHICGIAGSQVTNGKIPRISGMDPALPGFEYFGIDKYVLDASDADFVDVIHTCGGVLGVLQSIGDADFYPNGGLPCQPGCRGLQREIEGCSHGLAWKYFARTILNSIDYIGTKCDSWENYLDGYCNYNQKDLMGEYANATIRGNFYLIANYLV